MGHLNHCKKKVVIVGGGPIGLVSRHPDALASPSFLSRASSTVFQRTEGDTAIIT
jgi:hypothetical protein